MRLVYLVFAGITVACCQPITPTPATTGTPLQGSPAVQTPAAPVTLRVAATVLDQCGSEGGCAYYADLEGPGGPWRAKFAGDGELVVSGGLPATVAPGDYNLTFSSFLVSDVIVNNEPPEEKLDASCSTDFTVAASEQVWLLAQGTFGADECSVNIVGSAE
jgi:hypothetical protein